jgi:hypothetical protein
MTKPHLSLTAGRICNSGFIVVIRALSVLLFLCLLASAQDNAASIVQKSAEANKRDWAAGLQFDDCERDRDKDSDKTYAVTMLFGSPYQRLVAVNGRPLQPAQQRQELKKFEEAKAQRRRESPQQRSQRISKYQVERKSEQTLFEQMTTAFDFHLIGDQTVDGHTVYAIGATPRKGYRPPNRDSKVLTGMQGTLWVDHDTFQWVRAEAHVTHPVLIEGFLAEVEPGTQFEFEKKPVSRDVWLVSHFSMKSRARVLRVFPHRGQEDDTFFQYRKTSNAADTKWIECQDNRAD